MFKVVPRSRTTVWREILHRESRSLGTRMYYCRNDNKTATIFSEYVLLRQMTLNHCCTHLFQGARILGQVS